MTWGTAGVGRMNHLFNFGISACGKFLLHEGDEKPPREQWPKCSACLAALDRELRPKPLLR